MLPSPTSRENLAQLLVSAMSFGYFLHNAETTVGAGEPFIHV